MFQQVDPALFAHLAQPGSKTGRERFIGTDQAVGRGLESDCCDQ